MSSSLYSSKKSPTPFLYCKHLKMIITILIMISLGFLFRLKLFEIYLSKNNINTMTTTLKISERNNFNVIRNETNTKATETSFSQRMKKLLNCEDKSLKMELLQYGRYWLLKNYIIGRKSMTMGCGESITYTTHGDYTFIKNLPGLVER